jgi:hypothetical protein
MKKLYSLILVFGVFLGVLAQPTVLFTGLTNTAPSPTNSRFTLNDLGSFRQARFQSNQTAASGVTAFAFHIGSAGTPDYSQNWRGYTTALNVLANYNVPVLPTGGNGGPASALYNSGGGGVDNYLPAVTTGNYYTFNILENGAANSNMSVQETTYNPVTIGATAATTAGVVTTTTSATPNAAEFVYVRWSLTNNFVSSSLVQMTFSGTTGTAVIPQQAAGTTVYYYVMSSSATIATIGTNYDVMTLNLGTNGSYIQAAANTTTLIDPAGAGGFESVTFTNVVSPATPVAGWNTANSTTDSWIANTTAGASAGTKSAYVTAASPAWTYSQTSTIQHLYYDVTIPVDQTAVTVKFKWKAGGEGTTTSDWDNLKIFWGTTAAIGVPVANTALLLANQVSDGTAISGMYKLNSAAYTQASIGVTGLPGVTYRLVFSWKSDSSTIANPPASIDEVSVVSTYSATVANQGGGLWSSPATWAGGVVPVAGANVSIPTGSIVTVDQLVAINNLTIDGTLQWNATANAMTLTGNLQVNSTGKLLAYTPVATPVGQAINIAGNFVNDGYCNLAVAGTSLNFNGTTGSTLSGTGTFQGDGTRGIIRSLLFSSLGGGVINTTQNLTVTFGLTHGAGTLNTNGKLKIDNTAQVYGQSFNQSVASIAVTAMGSLYTVKPIVFGAPAIQWTNITAVNNTLYVSGDNVYRSTAAANIGPAAPTHITGTVQNLLWIGTVGTLGTPFQFNASVTVGTQIFYGNNLYICTVAGIPSSAAPPVHITGTAASGAATFRYAGTVTKAAVNWDAVTQTVRSLDITQAGIGLTGGQTAAFSVGVAAGTGSSATATAVYFQQIAGPTNSLFNKSGGAATITGGLTINSDQGASLASTDPLASSGVGAISTSNGGVNYTVAPTVAISMPTAINLITNPGSGYTTAPTITVTGGVLAAGSVAYLPADFVFITTNGKVMSVHFSAGVAKNYTTQPTITFSAPGSGVTATMAVPATCTPVATPIIANGQIINFNITNPGFGYTTIPTVGLLGGTATTVATAPTARIGLYNLVLSVFSPLTLVSQAVVQGDDAAIPANRKMNQLFLNNASALGMNLTGNLTLMATSSPITIVTSTNATGNVLDLGGNTLTFANNGTSTAYTGFTPVFGASGAGNAYIKNGSIAVYRRGLAGTSSSISFPFASNFTYTTGVPSVTAGSNVTRLTVSDTAAPSNTTVGTGLAVGTKSYRVRLGDVANIAGATPTNGLLATVNMAFNSTDALTQTQDQLYVGEAPALTGGYTLRTAAYGASGALPATGTFSTITAAPGPIASTNDLYYAFCTSVPSVLSVDNTTLCASSGTFTITGTNLLGVTAVSIGGVPVSSFVVASATSISGVAGAAVTGFMQITKGGKVIAGSQEIIVNASLAAPSVTATTVTINTGELVNVTATGSGGTFKWYNAATGGTILFTGATFNQAVCSGNIWVLENDGTCDGARTLVTIVRNPNSISASVPTFCGTGGNSVLTASPIISGATYTWTSLTAGATISTTSGATTTASITATSDFKLDVINNGCTSTSYVSVGVYPLPVANIVAPNGGCQGTGFTIASGLSSGNFSATCITAPAAVSTPAASAVTLMSANAATATGLLPAGVAFVIGNSATDDSYWSGVPVGFNFNFFGATVTNVFIGTNGTINLGATGSTQFNFAGPPSGFPSTANPASTIAVCARDLRWDSGNGTIKYWTEGFAPNRRFIVQFVNGKPYSYPTTANMTAEAVFYETIGTVDIRVFESTNGTSVINDSSTLKYIGLQDATRLIGATAPNCAATPNTANYWNGIGLTGQILASAPQAWRFSPPSNYTVRWYANTLNTAVVGFDPVTANDVEILPTAPQTTTNNFSITVNPTTTTTYKIKYTNQTTGCSNTISTTSGSASQTTAVIYDTVAPTGVAALSSLPSICVSNSITLSTDYDVVSTPSNANGLFYQWQSSPIGANTFTDIALATAATLVTTPTAGLDYRMKFKRCSGAETFSSLVSVPFTNNILTTTGGTRCGTGTATVSATFAGAAGVVVNWYSAATGGTLLGTGSPFTTASISADSTFYAAAETTGPACSSPRVGAMVTVTAPPALAASANQTICNDAVGLLEVTPATLANYDGYTWSPITNLYTDAAGTVAYTAGTNASTVYVRGTTASIRTYSVIGTNSVAPYCSLTATSVVTIMPNPTISGSPICISGTTTLSLSNTTVAAYGAGTIQWSQAPTLGGVYTDIGGANGVTYTTNNLSAESYFKATLTSPSGACSVAPLFTVLVNSPAITSVSGATNCGASSMSLSVVGNGTVYKWYDALTSGTLLQSSASNSYTTPLLSTVGATNYYVETITGYSATTIGPATDPAANLSSFVGPYGVYFATTTAVDLSSVDIYPSTAGTLTLTLKDTAGTAVASQQFVIVAGDISNTVKKTLTLSGFNIPAGVSGYSLNYDIAIYRGAGTYSYPYAGNGITMTGNTLDGDNITGGSRTYFFNVVATSGCASTPRTQVTATVTTAPDVILSATTNATPVCAGTPTPVVTIASVTNGTIGSFNSYIWSPTTGVVGDEVNGWTFTNYTNTVYTLTASSIDPITGIQTPNSCTDLSTFSLVLAPSPTRVDITNADGSVCINKLQAVTATGGNILNNSLLSESFDTGLGSFTFTAGSTVTDMDWTPRANGFAYGSNIFSGSTNGFMLANSDLGGSGTSANTKLISPSFSTMSHTGITLSFKEYLNNATDIAAAVEISSDNFVTSTILRNNLTTDIGSLSTFNNTVIAIPAAFENLPSVKIRFRYEGSFDWYWAVDEVKVKGTYNLLNWTATNATVFTDAAGTIPYIAPPAVGATYPSTVYVRPLGGSTVVTASATIAGSCPLSDVLSFNTNTGISTLTDNAGTPEWQPGVPTGNTSLIIDGPFTSSGSISGCDCRFTPNATTVVISSGDTLNITNDFIVENGTTVTFENNASLVQENPLATNTGDILYKRNTGIFGNDNDFAYFGSPVIGQQIKKLWMTTINDTFYSYNATIGTLANNYVDGWEYVSPNGVMTSGRGYIARTQVGGSNGDYESGSTPYTLSTNWVLPFKGVPFNGSTSTPIAITNAPATSGGIQNTNYLSNPYPSAIDINILKAANNSLSSKFYFWNHNAQLGTNVQASYDGSSYSYYSTILNAGSNASSGRPNPTRYISAGQGFFVDGAANGTVTFNNSQRVGGNNSAFLRSAAAVADATNVPKLWLNLTHLTLRSQQLIGYLQGASNEYDFDIDIDSPLSGNIHFYGVLANNIVVLQARAAAFNDSDIVPLGYKGTNAGVYKIAIDRDYDHDSSWDQSQHVYLQDNTLGIVHDLSNGDYTFTTAAGTFDSRFVLKYTNALGTNDNDILDNTVIVAKDKNVLKVRSSIEEIKSITIFDILGRKVYAKDALNNKDFSEVDVVKNDQTLIVKITLTNGAVVTKKIIY